MTDVLCVDRGKEGETLRKSERDVGRKERQINKPLKST